MASRTLKFTTPFKTHLSFFSRPSDGLITFPSALYGSLALGLNFPISCVLGVGLPLLYGNTGPFRSQVNIAAVSVERPQLQGLGDVGGGGYSRAQLLEQVKNDSWINWLHILQCWNLAADERGLLSAEDVRLFQRGALLFELEKRRKSRDDVVPFARGGPFS